MISVVFIFLTRSVEVSDSSIYNILYYFAPSAPLIISFVLTLIFYDTRAADPDDPPQRIAQPDLAS